MSDIVDKIEEHKRARERVQEYKSKREKVGLMINRLITLFVISWIFYHHWRWEGVLWFSMGHLYLHQFWKGKGSHEIR